MGTDAKHLPLSQAERLRQDAETAAEVRALANHPDVVALRVEKVRTQVDAAIWVGILLGLAFTMVNVQSFAAAGAAVFSMAWIAAWLLDPMVSLVLIAVLRAEQITARYQVETGKWVHRTKWFAFLATYVMNTWQSWATLHLSGIVLHSVPPVLVFLAAETAPVLRDRLTEAVHRAAMPAFTGQERETEPEDASEAPAVSAPAKPTARRKRSTPRKQGRKLLADYLAEARAAWAPGIEVTPAWVRSVCPDASRGTSKNVADALAAETVTAPMSLPTRNQLATEEAA
ncbi:hypothetical protein BAY61_02420 [Prauserella marina]|uniref:Uncharacterized protein n=1 Tax=Prauserella marina TaxID=530584 RepID=A0A222VJZ3_9PSEU|nr:hypothetical protein [Prauserella marina]ASR34031.1 hypothetical protein BAY61_02420 [Prauserella marina]PWV82659.1 hypothetical protein DES30_102903 [Prauserella marina]SDC74043.1 hypothetical protein SAMN05421630_103439 [Prauserella marina]